MPRACASAADFRSPDDQFGERVLPFRRRADAGKRRTRVEDLPRRAFECLTGYFRLKILVVPLTEPSTIKTTTYVPDAASFPLP